MSRLLLWLLLGAAVLTSPEFLTRWGTGYDTILRPVTLMTARLTQDGLSILGMETSRDGSVITERGGFAIEITYRCTGVVLSAMLAMAIVAARPRLRSKLAGLGFGLPCLYLMNLIRLMSLVWIGAHHRGMFALAHDIVWQVIMILTALAVWFVWYRSAVQPGTQTDGLRLLKGDLRGVVGAVSVNTSRL